MKNLMNKTKSALQTIGLFVVGAIVAGFGVMMMVLLALFSLAMLAIAMIISPFVKRGDRKFDHREFMARGFAREHDKAHAQAA